MLFQRYSKPLPAIPGVTDVSHKPVSVAYTPTAASTAIPSWEVSGPSPVGLQTSMLAQAIVATATVQPSLLTSDHMDVDIDNDVRIPYERDRLKVIKRNRVQMRLLGLGGSFLPKKIARAKKPKKAKVFGTSTAS